MGEFGSGKTLILQRIYQQAINEAIQNNSFPIPIFKHPQQWNEKGSLQKILEAAADEFSILTNQINFLIIDELDKASDQEAQKILAEASLLIRKPEYQNSLCVIIASRSMNWMQYYCQGTSITLVKVNELTDNEVITLLKRVTKSELSHSFYSDWSKFLQDIVRRPLFALILGRYLLDLRDSQEIFPRTTGDLLSWLVSTALDRSNIDLSVSRKLLMRLGNLSVSYGGSVPITEIVQSSSDELEQILQTRLVVKQGRFLSFALPVLAQYFAALDLEENPLIIHELVVDQEQLRKWTYPLLIAIPRVNHEKITQLLAPIVKKYPCFAAELIREVSTSFGIEQQSLPPSRECGQQIHIAMQAWMKGLEPLAGLIIPLQLDGKICSIGIKSEGARLHWAWYMGSENKEPIIDLPPTYLDHESDWFGGYCLHSYEPAWAWRWTLDMLVRWLWAKIDVSRFVVDNSDLAREAAWNAATAILRILRIDTFQHEQIAISDIEPELKRLERENFLNYDGIWGGASPSNAEYQYYLKQLRLEIDRLRDLEETVFYNPWPVTDINIITQEHFSLSFSTAQLQHRITKVYKAALDAYQLLIMTWFKPLLPSLDIAVRLPATLVGVIYPKDVFYTNIYRKSPKNSHQPQFHWFLQPLSAEKENNVLITIGNQYPDQEFSEKAMASNMSISYLRPEASLRMVEPFFASENDSQDELLSNTPVNALIFRWLQDDLERAGWGSHFLRLSRRRMFS
jgi:NACHT domain